MASSRSSRSRSIAPTHSRSASTGAGQPPTGRRTDDRRAGMSSEDLVVGVDVGSQGTCAQAIDAAGEAIATSYVPHSLAYPQPGWAEQDPLEWLAAVARALDEVRRAVDGRPLRAISFGSQLDGLVAADKSGTAVGPAIIWMDRRAGEQCERACETIEPDRLRQLTGCNLDPGHVAAKISWLSDHRPEQH